MSPDGFFLSVEKTPASFSGSLFQLREMLRMDAQECRLEKKCFLSFFAENTEPAVLFLYNRFGKIW